MPRVSNLPASAIQKRVHNPVDENHPSRNLQGFHAPTLSPELLATPITLQIKKNPLVKRVGNRRNIAAELNNISGGNNAALEIWRGQQNVAIHKKVKAASTLSQEADMRQFWIDFLMYGPPKLSLEDANMTIVTGAHPPDCGTILEFLLTIATEGKSMFKGERGWSYKTTIRGFHRLLGMFSSAGVGSIPVDEIDNMRNASAFRHIESVIVANHYHFQAISRWAMELGIIHTNVKERGTLRSVDYNALMAGIYGPGIPFETNFQRVQFALIMNLMWETGCRTGTFAEPDTAKGLAHCVRLGDCNLLFSGMTEYGPSFHLFLKFKFNKGMKLNDAEFTQTNIRSLPGPMALFDALVPFLAITCYLDVWEYDLLSLVFGTAETVPPMGYVIPLKKEFTTTSLTKAGKPLPASKLINKYQPKFKQAPVPQMYPALTNAALIHNIQKVQIALNWPSFIGKSLRYSWCSHMTGKLPENVLKYSLGHRLNSVMAATVYQQPDRPEDLQAHRHNLDHDTRMIDYHSSVSFASGQFQPSVRNSEVETRIEHPLLAPFVDSFALDCQRFSKLASGRGFAEFLDSPDKVPTEAQDAFDDAFDKYIGLCRKYNEVFHKEIERDLQDVSESGLDKVSEIETSSNRASSSKSSEEINTASNPSGNSSPAFRTSLSEVVDSMASAHPLLSLVVVDKGRNARANLIKHYIKLFQNDDLIKEKKCPICFDCLGPGKDASSLRQQNKMAQHIYTCEGNRYESHSKRCNFCGGMVNANKDEFTEHIEACYIKVFAKLLRKRDGFPLKQQITVYNDHTFTVIFCPFCLAVELNWNRRNGITTGHSAALAHLLSHFKVPNFSVPEGETKPFLDGNNLECWFINCSKKDMTVPEAMSHLNTVHRYPLLKCLCDDDDHDHDSMLVCSKLEILPTLVPGRMVLYELDLKMLKDHPNGQQYIDSYVCLVEQARKPPAKAASLKQLAAFLDAST